MSDALLTLTRLPWHWEWVPHAHRGDEAREAWTQHLVALFEDWTREGLAAVRRAWPTQTGIEFPLVADMVGRGAARWLLDRADQLPAWARLAWGAAFVDGAPRWAPVPVVVEFRRPQHEDSIYLMESVGAAGRDGDARMPVVDYVTTPMGDGVRVFALERTAGGAAYGRVNAALRLDIPSDGKTAAVSIDVLLSTHVFETALMAVIGPGVEQLMQRIAADCAPQPGARPAPLLFITAAEGSRHD
jgi:hypothetical protein